MAAVPILYLLASLAAVCGAHASIGDRWQVFPRCGESSFLCYRVPTQRAVDHALVAADAFIVDGQRLTIVVSYFVPGGAVVI